MMSTKYKLHGVNHILTKGAIDAILDRCDSIAAKDGVRPITQRQGRYTQAEYRVFRKRLACAYFCLQESDEELNVNTEYGYTFLGLVSMIDRLVRSQKQRLQMLSEQVLSCYDNR